MIDFQVEKTFSNYFKICDKLLKNFCKFSNFSV